MGGVLPNLVFNKCLTENSIREDTSKYYKGGLTLLSSCDVSPIRRVNQSIWMISMISRNKCFRSTLTIQESLAEEIFLALTASKSSGSIAKKMEIESIAAESR